MGSHVSRTARIEPVTPPGEVYVTEAFAAALELQGRDDTRLRLRRAHACREGLRPAAHVPAAAALVAALSLRRRAAATGFAGFTVIVPRMPENSVHT